MRETQTSPTAPVVRLFLRKTKAYFSVNKKFPGEETGVVNRFRKPGCLVSNYSSACGLKPELLA
jgi:hypothetical protein